jgi:hypothetical protein
VNAPRIAGIQSLIESIASCLVADGSDAVIATEMLLPPDTGR